MELPKNITQIGESNRNCKIYVEDYVVSYIKQINQLACNKDMAVALYGIRKTENSITYLFIYGACKLDFIQRETRHLSQAQHQEIEKLRKKYFPEHEFLGYRLLNGEMVEGFHICEQDICRYVAGYAQFYEKNDNMLAYMLDTRTEEAVPEAVEQGKYDAVRKRQEERREEYSGECREEYSGEHRGEYQNVQKEVQGMRKMRMSAAAVFGLLCLAGLSMLWDEQNMEDLQVAAGHVITEFTEQKVPDAEVDTLITQDKLSQAILEENENQNATAQTSASEATSTPGVTQAPESTQTSEEAQPPAVTPAPEVTPTSEHASTSATESVAASASYIIQKGDTLIDICIRQYGSDTMLQQVCSLNGISNPDDIKVGQKILLP